MKRLTKIILYLTIFLAIGGGVYFMYAYKQANTPSCFSNLSKTTATEISKEIFLASSKIPDSYKEKVKIATSDFVLLDSNEDINSKTCRFTVTIGYEDSKDTLKADGYMKINKGEKLGQFWYDVEVLNLRMGE